VCFKADTSGIYTITVNAFAPCGNDFCQFPVKVTITPTPVINCPPEFDTLVCVAAIDSICIPIGSLPAVATVAVTPIGKYANGAVCVPVDTPGVYRIRVYASTTCGAALCTLKFNLYDNSAPAVHVPPTAEIPRCEDETGQICIGGIYTTDTEGDPLTLTKICGPGQLSLVDSDSGYLCFTPTRTDTTYEFCIRATDGCHTTTQSFFVNLFPSTACSLCVDVAIKGPPCSPVGVEVDVHLEVSTNDAIGGFDLLLSYDQSVMAFLFAMPGAAIAGKWEYFTYRTGPFSGCSGACPSGMIRVVAIADVNNGAAHPPPGSLTPAGNIADLRFRIANNQGLSDQFLPISFYWLDCGDNSFSDPSGNQLFVDGRIYNSENAVVWDEFDDARYPESARIRGLGAPDNPCLSGDKALPQRCVDFHNGGVCVIHQDSIDARGDVNLNGLAYEVADAVLFTNYFIYGIRVFRINIEGQIAATDVNADGATLTVADLVHLVRVVTGDAAPVPKIVPTYGTPLLTLERTGDRLTVKSSSAANIGAVALTFALAGAIPQSVSLGAGASNMDLIYHTEDGRLRALIHENPVTATGEYIPAGDVELLVITLPAGTGEVRLEAADMSDDNGWLTLVPQVTSKLIPTSFALAQNYPNPFNPSTTIEFSIPVRSSWTMTIFNSLGQQVRRFDGVADPGVARVVWDGADNAGQHVASGMYFYSAKAGSFVETRKMILMK